MIEGPDQGPGSELEVADQEAVGVADQVIAELVAQGLTVALAESLTGGAACALLAGVPGASQVLRGAIVVYAVDLKASQLDVDAEELARTGPVTAPVAVAMARGVRRRLGADVGLSTTGEAGPDSASGAPVGTVFVAVATRDREWVRELDLEGGRAAIRAGSARRVLELLSEVLAELRGG